MIDDISTVGDLLEELEDYAPDREIELQVGGQSLPFTLDEIDGKVVIRPL